DRASAALAAGLRLARGAGARLTVLHVGRSRGAREALARRLAARGVRLAGYESLAGVRIAARTLAALAARATLLVLPEPTSRNLALVAELAARFRGALMLTRERAPDDDGR